MAKKKAASQGLAGGISDLLQSSPSALGSSSSGMGMGDMKGFGSFNFGSSPLTSKPQSKPSPKPKPKSRAVPRPIMAVSPIFIRNLKENIPEESKATQKYRKMANQAPTEADKKLLLGVANQEHHHETIQAKMLKRITG